MALGGAQSVGGSCYYLRLGNNNIMLDCGTYLMDGLQVNPSTYPLLKTPFMQSMRQLNSVYVSHVHQDHIGFLPDLLTQTGDIPVYMTELTKELAEYQLYDKNIKYINDNREIITKRAFDNVKTVSMLKEMDMGDYKVEFYPAGHVPGAMMTLITYKDKRILYTGDISINKSILTDECLVPDNVDILIMCGIHSKDNRYTSGKLHGLNVAEEIKSDIAKGRNVYCSVNQISKGIEFMCLLNSVVENTPIYIDKTILSVVERFERKSIPVMKANNHPLIDERLCDSSTPYIIIGNKKMSSIDNKYSKKLINYSIHDSYKDEKDFVKRVNPKIAYIVHCAAPLDNNFVTLEQEIMQDAECRTQIVFPEEGELYRII